MLPEDWREYLAPRLREVFSQWRTSEGILADLTGPGLYTPGTIDITAVRIFILGKVADGALRSGGFRVGGRPTQRYIYSGGQIS